MCFGLTLAADRHFAKVSFSFFLQMLVRDGGDLDDIPLTPVQPEKPGVFRPSVLPLFHT